MQNGIVAASAGAGIPPACSTCGTNLSISAYSAEPEPEAVLANFAEAAVLLEKVNSIEFQCAERPTQ